eukprot:4598933-Pleurochrysis_carterae.AAC.1
MLPHDSLTVPPDVTQEKTRSLPSSRSRKPSCGGRSNLTRRHSSWLVPSPKSPAKRSAGCYGARDVSSRPAHASCPSHSRSLHCVSSARPHGLRSCLRYRLSRPYRAAIPPVGDTQPHG